MTKATLSKQDKQVVADEAAAEVVYQKEQTEKADEQEIARPGSGAEQAPAESGKEADAGEEAPVDERGIPESEQ